MNHEKLCVVVKEMGVPVHLIDLMRNLFSRDYGEMNKVARQGCILSTYHFNLESEISVRFR